MAKNNLDIIFKFIAKNPPTALICGGILLLILSPAYKPFGSWGWICIILGFILQVLWVGARYLK